VVFLLGIDIGGIFVSCLLGRVETLIKHRDCCCHEVPFAWRLEMVLNEAMNREGLAIFRLLDERELAQFAQGLSEFEPIAKQ